MMLERDRTYNDILDRVERLEMRIEDLRDVARPQEVVLIEGEAPNWQAVAGWVSTGTVLQDVNGRIVLDPTIPRILIDADGYIESADFVTGVSGFQINGGTCEFNDVTIRGTLIAGGGTVIIDDNGIDIDFDPTGAGTAHIRFRDFSAAHDGVVYWYAYANDAAFVDAITSILDVKGDTVDGDNPNALYIVNAQGKGQTQFVGSGGTGLKLQSWETPLGTYYGAVLSADDTIARLISYGASWVDCKPGGDILIRSYLAGGDVQAQLSDAAGASQLEVLDSAGAEVAYINSDGKALFALDMHPDSDGRGLFARMVNRLGISTYDEHFRSGAVPPTGYTWQGAPFGGTPAALNYSYVGDYLYHVPAASTRYFLSKAVTNAAASWQNKGLYGRFNARLNGRHGLRFDDGTDNNYAQMFATGEANDGTMSVSFQYRAGGGAVTTVTSNINVPASEFIVLYLLMSYSAPNYTARAYLLAEDGTALSVTGFTVAVAWAPVAGRAGLFGENPSVSTAIAVECDWFRNTFT